MRGERGEAGEGGEERGAESQGMVEEVEDEKKGGRAKQTKSACVTEG